jgi:hypothetical protein
MAELNAEVARRLERLPRELQDEFPQVPLDSIARHVEDGARLLLREARFPDFVPLLVHRAVRERLRHGPPLDAAPPAGAVAALASSR